MKNLRTAHITQFKVDFKRQIRAVFFFVFDQLFPEVDTLIRYSYFLLLEICRLRFKLAKLSSSKPNPLSMIINAREAALRLVGGEGVVNKNLAYISYHDSQFLLYRLKASPL